MEPDEQEMAYRRKHPSEVRYRPIWMLEWETLTQETFDEIIKFINTLSIMNQPTAQNREAVASALDFKLAVYPNPTRDDGVFVAEDRPIEPYEGVKTLDGKPCYPSTPRTGYSLGMQLPHAFAHELVRRWNRGP
jgi:hypothetical protein